MPFDGSLLVSAEKWGACGWAEVQLDYDEEMGPLHGMYGSMEAEYAVQRTIKRAELTAFLCLLWKVIGPIKVHVDIKGIIGGLRKGEKSVFSCRCRPVVKIWEDLQELVEASQWKWHMCRHTVRRKKKMTKIERFVTEGNEKAVELAKAGAMLDEGFMAEARAKTLQQERGCVRSLAICGQLPLLGGGNERL